MAQLMKSSLQALSGLRTCTRCLLAETHDTITFDAEGVCNVCRAKEFRTEKVDWEERLQDLGTLLDTYRGKSSYDCIVPFSGGKDSTFTLWYLVTQHHVKPLVVRFDHGFLRPGVLANTELAISRLGVEFINYKPDWGVVRKVMRQAFLRKGDFCWHCHTGVFAFPMHMAIKHQVPLIIWGQANSEYNAFYRQGEQEEVDETRFNRYVNLGLTAEDMVGMAKVELEALWPFTYPNRQALIDLGYRSVNLGAYIPWDVKKQTAIIERELGWKPDRNENIPPGYEYEKIECFIQSSRDYLRWLKRGMGRANHLASVDIRDGRLTREEGLELVEGYDGKRPVSLDRVLEELEMTEGQFMEVTKEHVVDPHAW